MKSLEELRVIRERMQGTVAYRSEHESLEEAVASEHGKYRTHVLVCGGTGCTSSGSQKISKRIGHVGRSSSKQIFAVNQVITVGNIFLYLSDAGIHHVDG